MSADGGGRDRDVLVVGAGPTGLTLAAQLVAFGASVRVVDSAAAPVHESRALAIQPRTLEVLRPLSVSAELVRRGNPAVRLRLHTGGRTAEVALFDIGLNDTAYPFLLFLSQAQTEAVLGAYLTSRAQPVERGVRLETLTPDDEGVTCLLRRDGHHAERVRATYVVGCDGAHSTVREQAGIDFVGGGYPQTFLLADLDAGPLEPGVIHAYVTPTGPLLLFPLDSPAPWRLITARPEAAGATSSEGSRTTAAVSRGELQALVDGATGGAVTVAEPAWSSAFRLQHRHATTYRRGRVFLAGDAAHVHSPAGAQGMNTGIQDAVNLGWKLGLVCRGAADEALLDSYDAERRPVGAFVLRFTDRAFTAVTSTSPVLQTVRGSVAPRLLPLALRLRAGRTLAFRTVSQLAISSRQSPAVDPPRRRTWRGPRPGDRLPDAPVERDGAPTSLQVVTGTPAFHVLLCGPPGGWDASAVDALRERFGALLVVHHLVGGSAGPGELHDVAGLADARLRAADGTLLVVRPDGHLAVRSRTYDLTGARAYLARWLLHG
jgi:2-polyprenyl-6-methoxyphenol hydroxylase-like FAD-dependent oxidoreductase